VPDSLDLVRKYHENLPARIREYLRSRRGISEAVINLALLGWDGRRITIPISDREHCFAFFKLAKDPEDTSDSPKMLATAGSRAELYGWERILSRPEQIVICEGEFDRLVLESRGIAAVTSTGGATTFRREWAEYFSDIANVFICFDRDQAGREGTRVAGQLIPHARIVELPEDVGEGGDVTDFLVRLGKSTDDWAELLDTASPVPEEWLQSRSGSYTTPAEIRELKGRVRIEDLISRYVALRTTPQAFAARCPFHEDQNPSFVVYPATQSFFCFGCRARGDVLTFLMRMDKLSFPEALNKLRDIAPQ
jgi:DNA primase